MYSNISTHVYCVGRKLLYCATTAWLMVGCSTISPSLDSSLAPLPHYNATLTLEQGLEWRFYPLVVDINGDGYLDLVATARLADPSLRMWLGDGKGFTPLPASWSDIGYATLASSDINHDGFPDIVGASHFARVQTLLSDGKGGFHEKIMRREDGYAGAQLADVNGDGELDLVLLGFFKAGIEVYLGDGTGEWRLHKTLAIFPQRNMPGRALALGDLNHDGHIDLVAAFNRWGLYIYYGDGQGGFRGGPMDILPGRAFGAVAMTVVLADVNKDTHPDIIINGTSVGGDKLNGPDVYLGDGLGDWQASSIGLKALKASMGGMALADLDQDGALDIVAGGSLTGDIGSGASLFWFRGDGKGGWQFMQKSGLPTQGLFMPYGVALADLDRDKTVEIITLHGGTEGRMMVWKPQ